MDMKKKTVIALAAIALCATNLHAETKSDALAQEASYRIGDKGPGGGIVFYYSEEGFPVQDSDDASPVICHYLECSRKDMRNLPWCPCEANVAKTLGEIGAGKLNTARILNDKHKEPLTTSNCAAKACAEYSTKTTQPGEWYMPSIEEVRLIYDNLRESRKITSNKTYWSSTQDDFLRVTAWFVYFKSGTSCCCRRKNQPAAVRAF